MAKSAKKKSAKEASNAFHNIIQASVKGNPKREEFKTGQLLKIEGFLKSDITEMRNLGSTGSTVLSNIERKAMLERLNISGDKYEIVGNRIRRKGDE